MTAFRPVSWCRGRLHGLSIVELGDDAGRATAVTPIRDPAFNRTFSVARVADRYVAVNASTETASRTSS